MASISEQGYGARLQNAQTLKNNIAGFSNYNPPRTEDTLVELEKLITACADANTFIASFTQSYTLAVKNRSDAFAGKENTAIQKLLSPISKAVQAQFGKESREYTSIANIIARMRSQTIEKTPATPDEKQKETISKSEMSFGSQLQNFKDLVASLEQLTGFNPSNDLIKIPNLKVQADKLDTLSQEVTSKTLPLSQKREQRRTLFEELNVRSQRIKSYVSANYGNKSPEYKAISKLKI